MNKVILNVVGIAACVGGLFLALDYAMAIPDVIVSYSTNECVSVVNYDGMIFSGGDYDCGNLPSKYNHVWSE